MSNTSVGRLFCGGDRRRSGSDQASEDSGCTCHDELKRRRRLVEPGSGSSGGAQWGHDNDRRTPATNPPRDVAQPAAHELMISTEPFPT